MQRWKGQRDEDSSEERPQHLYLVLDDWSEGYSIYKIDLFGDKNGFEDLPSALFKFEAPRRNPVYFAGAFDSKILAMQPIDSQSNFSSTPGILVYDVHMRSLMFGPRQRPDPFDPIYIPVGGRLFALAAGSFQLLYPPACDQSGWEDFEWMWHTLPDPPFQRKHVTSYGVHGDGRTIFVSVEGEGCTPATPATFSFDTAESMMKDACMWKQQGQWKMPFYGRAYFVPELDAWVGLTEKPGPNCRICSMDSDCKVKFCKEKQFIISALATLVGIGRSKFCMVEFYLVHAPTTISQLKPVLRLTVFSLRYDKNGDLTFFPLWCWEYNTPPQVSTKMLETPVTFWM